MLGQGAIATVYQARQGIGSEPCALKVLRQEYLEREAYCEHFRFESALAQSFAHLHLVPCLSHGEAGGFLYQQYPLLTGGDVQNVLRHASTGTMSLADSVCLAKHIAAGLARLHQLAVIHRDVKPGNILLDRRGNYCLADFGLAISNGKRLPMNYQRVP